MRTLNSNPKLNSVGLNAATWLVFMLLVSLLIYTFGNEENNSWGFIFLQGFTGFGIVLIPTVYFNTALAIPKLLARKKYFLYILSLLFFASLWGPLAIYLENWTDQNLFYEDAEPIESVFPGIFIILFTLVLSTLINLSYKWFIQLNKITRMENERLNMELSLLRNQINPHFFFNTLNNLYSLSLEKSSSTSEVILKLSEMMRYTIYECKATFVPIKQEIKYLKNYISLQQIRLRNRANIEFDLDIQDDNIQIAPMILIVLLENAFKHGVEKMTEGAYIKMRLTSTDKTTIFTIENNYENITNQLQQGGVGLENVKRRLRLIYANNHDIVFQDEEDTFNVTLKLDIN